ncbi:uncharacterized protein LOC126647540 [Myiozetetes cayanensis]|uniref:uncharacterized protein LOC126647540 n=1 Tax=Myiozetetes cayanensis TaxID=478635 RepID=UPI00215FD3BC|nr:uncharacterized protein LOC126647540 [Myiozetetes cayanensis]
MEQSPLSGNVDSDPSIALSLPHPPSPHRSSPRSPSRPRCQAETGGGARGAGWQRPGGEPRGTRGESCVRGTCVRAARTHTHTHTHFCAHTHKRAERGGKEGAAAEEKWVRSGAVTWSCWLPRSQQQPPPPPARLPACRRFPPPPPPPTAAPGRLRGGQFNPSPEAAAAGATSGALPLLPGAPACLSQYGTGERKRVNESPKIQHPKEPATFRVLMEATYQQSKSDGKRKM